MASHGTYLKPRLSSVCPRGLGKLALAPLRAPVPHPLGLLSTLSTFPLPGLCPCGALHQEPHSPVPALCPAGSSSSTPFLQTTLPTSFLLPFSSSSLRPSKKRSHAEMLPYLLSLAVFHQNVPAMRAGIIAGPFTGDSMSHLVLRREERAAPVTHRTCLHRDRFIA